MGRRNGSRIEPRFDAPSRRGDEFSVDDDDRVQPTGKRRRKSPADDRDFSMSRRGRRRSGGGGFGLGRLVYWGFILCIWAGIGSVGLMAYYAAKMPSVADWTVPQRPPNVRLVAVDGALLANRGTTGGEEVPLAEMSHYIPQAVVAIEDRRFYSHFGVDPLGLARAMVQNVLHRGLSQGGSTLTQQLAKNLFLKPDRTLERKAQEVMLALWLEHEHSKDEILELYLNRVYFGSGAYGVEAASRRYFGKSARDVTLPEAAVLAGLLKAPSKLSPARDPQAAADRSKLVLAAMRDEGVIGDKELRAALATAPERPPSTWTGSENYVADRVVDDLPGLIGDVKSDITVETTVDLTLQKLAEKSIRDLIDRQGAKLAVSQGVLVSIDNSGAVRAMVGGYDYGDSQFDRATEARRQPGSAFKPFVYLAAMEQGMTPDTIRNDAPVQIGKWTPENYNGKYYGRVTLATALAKSLNSVAAQLVMEVGVGSVVEVAHRMGIQSDITGNAAIALGTSEVTPLELTAAYVPFANGGLRPQVHFIKRITDAQGKVLYERPPERAPRVITLQVVGMMNAMMSETLDDGTARKAKFDWPAAGKTGTSQNSRDAWFVGYTANLTTAVWFGNDDGHAMKKVTGGALPAIAWHDFMVAAHRGVAVAALPGDWRSQPQVDPSVPNTELSADAAPTVQPGQPTQPAATASHADSASDTEAPTGSIDRPVPPADVGAPSRRRTHQTSILDVIFGAGG